MKLQVLQKDAPIVYAFLNRWMNKEDKKSLLLLSMDECEPIYFDCESTELSNCFMELEKKGFAQSVKQIFQGDHFYRSDTGKCMRCWRHRPELHWNNENNIQKDLCDRCAEVYGGKK